VEARDIGFKEQLTHARGQANKLEAAIAKETATLAEAKKTIVRAPST
jgi:hypothetical protein